MMADDPNPLDLPEDWTAALAQMRRGMADLAEMLRAYYADLLEAGFSEDQALMLVRDYQRSMVRGSDDG